MLSAAGEQISYADLVAAIDVGPRGTTLPQMRAAALSLGYETEIYKATPNDLQDLQLPVILHLDKDAADPYGMGHFVLLTAYVTDVKEATLFDGVTGTPTAVSFEMLRRMWTGYVLCPKQSSHYLEFLVSMGGAMFLCTIIERLARRRHMLMSSFMLFQGAVVGLPDAEPLDITYSTLRHYISGNVTESKEFRSRLIFDGPRLYHIKELVAPRPSAFADREYLFDGHLAYKSNSLGFTTVEEASSIEPTDSNLFWSDYAEAIGYDLPNTRREVGEPVAWLDRRLDCILTSQARDGQDAHVTYEAKDERRVWRLEVEDGKLVALASEIWTGGKLARRCRSDGYFPVGSHWIPGVVHCEEFDTSRMNGDRIAILDIVVESASSSAEALPRTPTLLKPGTVVGDARYGEVPTAQGGYFPYTLSVPIETLEVNWAACFKGRTTVSRFSLPGAVAGILCSVLVALVRHRTPRP